MQCDVFSFYCHMHVEPVKKHYKRSSEEHVVMDPQDPITTLSLKRLLAACQSYPILQGYFNPWDQHKLHEDSKLDTSKKIVILQLIHILPS